MTATEEVDVRVEVTEYMVFVLMVYSRQGMESGVHKENVKEDRLVLHRRQ